MLRAKDAIFNLPSIADVEDSFGDDFIESDDDIAMNIGGVEAPSSSTVFLSGCSPRIAALNTSHSQSSSSSAKHNKPLLL